MPRQIFEKGQYVMWRRTSRPSRWDTREGRPEPEWRLGIVSTITNDHRIYIRHSWRPEELKSIHGLDSVTVRNQKDLIRPATYAEWDARLVAALWRGAANEVKIKEQNAERDRTDTENLARGWKRLHEALGNNTDGAIVTAHNILEPLLDEHALRRYGAKEAVEA